MKLEQGGAGADKVDSVRPTDQVAAPNAQPPTASRISVRTQVVNPILTSIEKIEAELDDMLADMRCFRGAEPDVVMQVVSAHSARAVEIIVQITRIEVMRREWKPVREQTERVLAELKSQFQIASRAMAMRQLDWEMNSRGQT